MSRFLTVVAWVGMGFAGLVVALVLIGIAFKLALSILEVVL